MPVESHIVTGLYDLDTHLGGLQRGNISVVAGERDAPLDFVASIYASAAMKSQVDALLISASVPQSSLEKRLKGVARRYERDNQTGRRRGLLAASKRDMRLGNFDELGKEFGNELDLLIVDDIGSIRSATETKSPAGVMIRQLKRMAEEFDMHILATTGLARSTRGQGDWRPDLTNVDPAVVEAADAILLSYYPATFGLRTEDGESLDDVFEIIVAKGKQWEGGSIFLEFDPQTRSCSCIEAIERRRSPNYSLFLPNKMRRLR